MKKAAAGDGDTGEVLLQYLERRLDNVIFQLGFSTSRRQARQLVSHGFIFVNDHRVNIPSFLVKENDEIFNQLKDEGAIDEVEAISQ